MFWKGWLSFPFGGSSAFGTSSDEKSEALPDNRVYLTQAGAQKPKFSCTGKSG